MKIGLFTENYWRGGMDAFLINLLNSWPNSSDEFVLYSNDDHPGLIDLKSKISSRLMIKTHHKKTFVSCWRNVPFIFKWKIFRPLQVLVRYLFFIKHLFEFKTLLKNESFDRLMIVNGSYPGGDSCRAIAITNYLFFNKKSIHNIHNNFYPYSVLLWPTEGLIDYFVRKSSSVWITVSRSCALTYKSRPYFKDEIQVIPNGIEIKESAIVPNLHSTNKFTFLILANYEPRKGYEFLFEAAVLALKKNPHLHWICAGHTYDTNYKLALEGKLREHKLNGIIELRDFCPNTDTLFQMSQVLIQPSLHSESFGLVLIEAMRAKKAVIATRVGGMSEILQGWAEDFLIEPNDAVSLSEAMVKLSRNNNLICELAEKGYNIFLDQYTSQKMAQRYACLLEKCHD